LGGKSGESMERWPGGVFQAAAAAEEHQPGDTGERQGLQQRLRAARDQVVAALDGDHDSVVAGDSASRLVQGFVSLRPGKQG
jgi:hypothetical protein